MQLNRAIEETVLRAKVERLGLCLGRNVRQFEVRTYQCQLGK